MEVFEKIYYGNTVLQWSTALGIIIATILIGRLVLWLSKNMVRKVASKTTTQLDDLLIESTERPLVFIISLFGIWWAYNFCN